MHRDFCHIFIIKIENGSCATRYTGHVGAVNSVALHPTKNLAISGSGDTECHLWPFDLDSTTKTYSVNFPIKIF